jgi:hypothetical protein
MGTIQGTWCRQNTNVFRDFEVTAMNTNAEWKLFLYLSEDFTGSISVTLNPLR